MSTPTPGNGQPDYYTYKIKALETKISVIKANSDRLAKIISDPKASAARKAAAKAAKTKADKDLATYDKQRGDLQNQYYQSTGQYDKLLSGTDRDAFLALKTLFSSYNLGSLADSIFNYVKNGYSADTISILLQDTKEYKERFAGNEARKKAGLPVLSAGEYLATEASYRQIMQSAGLPAGFYDQPSDFSGWIGGNVSPNEIQTRVDLATQATTLANPNYKAALNAMGISDGELTSYFLDQTKALPYIQKAAATAAVGAQALAQGLQFDQQYAESLATQGITADQAAQGYSQIATDLQNTQNLAAIYGSNWTQREAEQATFEGKAGAINKQKRLASQERASFGGTTGAARGGLAGKGGAR